MIQKIEDFAAQSEARTEAWVEKYVIPVLQASMDDFQGRIKKGVKFLSGMGTFGFYFYPDAGHWDWEFTNAMSCVEVPTPLEEKLRVRFPRMVEFVDAVVLLQDQMDYVMGSIIPINFKGIDND